ncbi:hypothetical protein [Tautonia rosea]|uniref:hypothetical protein n=1 Tax=Tautonia rosea TaxID=2728037 RepID=UPI001472FD2A|nr:hypothetical protein [Tautonia rosea]
MSNGWPGACPGRRVIPMLMAPILSLVLLLTGCAQGQKRPGFFEKNSMKPLFPKASAPRPEPGLRVQAPGVDVEVSNRDGKEVEVARSPGFLEGSSGVSLFRSTSSSRSLENARPLD